MSEGQTERPEVPAMSLYAMPKPGEWVGIFTEPSLGEVAKRVSGALHKAGALKVEPMLEPWPDYLQKLAAEAFVGDAAVSLAMSDSVRDEILSAAQANAVRDLDRAADARVAQLRIETLDAEADLMRQTIAEMSRRPTQAAYDILAAELAALKVAVEPREPADPWANALRWSV